MILYSNRNVKRKQQMPRRPTGKHFSSAQWIRVTSHWRTKERQKRTATVRNLWRKVELTVATESKEKRHVLLGSCLIAMCIGTLGTRYVAGVAAAPTSRKESRPRVPSAMAGNLQRCRGIIDTTLIIQPYQNSKNPTTSAVALSRRRRKCHRRVRGKRARTLNKNTDTATDT